MMHLKNESCWACWRYELDEDGKLTKVPRTTSGRKAKVNVAGDWTTYDKAASAAEKIGCVEDLGGIALRFADGLCGIDIDGNKETGEHNALESEVRQLFDGTYCEASPSGTGCHILFKVDVSRVPQTVAKGKARLDDKYYQKNHNNELECYISGLTYRFFTYSGKQLSETDEIRDMTNELLIFLDKYMLRPPREPSEHTESSSVKLEREEVAARLELARRAANGDKFKRLYDDGDIHAILDANGKANDDDSVADFSLCCMLAFWLNKDADLVNEAFCASKLMRPKWYENRGGMTYGELTIDKAIEATQDVYVPPRRFKYRPLDDDDWSDRANATTFSEMYREKLRWCSALGWLVWTGTYWRQDDGGAVLLAQEFSNNMFQEAKAYLIDSIKASEDGKPSADADAYRKFALRSSSERGINAMLNLAKSRLAIDAEELDADEYALNTAAGIVDLKTGELKPHTPSAFITKIAPYSPGDGDAKLWRDFLKLVTGGDVALEAYMQEVAGGCCIGRVKDEQLTILHGGGRNGKSTFLNAIQTVLGDYATSFDADALTMDFRGNYGSAMAVLRGVRLAITGELEQGQKLSIKTLKRVASTDRLTFKMLYQEQVTVKATHHVLMMTNVLPHISATDEGTQRRITIVPFVQKMPTGKDEIKDFASVLAAKAGGSILQWLIDGAVEYHQGGYHIEKPAVVIAATAEYQRGECNIEQFIDECCELSPLANVTLRDLYAAYVNWTSTSDANRIMKRNEFNAELELLNRFRSTKPQHRVCWHGLRLKNEQ